MLEDSLLEAIKEVNKVLKEKYERKSDRYFIMILVLVIIIIPIFAFENWFGKVAGLVLMILIFSTFVFSKSNRNSDE